MQDILAVPGTFNFRELGGFETPEGTVRTGVLMRSDGLLELGERGNAALHDIGIRTAIDLREPMERDADACDLDDRVVVYENPIANGIFDGVDHLGLPEIYEMLLAHRGDRFARAVSLLAQPDALPGVFFCSAGKDRTGLLSGLILSALGVDDDDVAAHYAVTETLIHGDFRDKLVQRALKAGFSEQALAVKLGSPAPLMHQILARVGESHGNAAEYLKAHGLKEEELECLRSALIDT